MERTRGGRRVGWLGWSAAIVLGLVVAVGGFVWWALSNNSVASLDRVDALFVREPAARLVAVERYGVHPAQKFELLVPEGAPPAGGFPLVAFFHGGGWHSGDPHDYRFIARALAERGYATALIGYRLVPAGRFPNMLLDSAAGLRAALTEAAGHRVDTARVGLMGHSAGAYNATMLALDPRWLGDAGVPADAIKGAVILAGPADFYPFEKKSSINAMSHWSNPEQTQPVNYARADAPPLLLVHGTEDTVVRPRNATILARTMTARGAPTQATLIEGMGHNGLVITLARPFDRDRRVGDAVFAFLAGVLPTSAPVKAASR